MVGPAKETPIRQLGGGSLWGTAACLVAAVTLERKKGAEHQKDAGPRNKPAAALTNRGRHCCELGWEEYAEQATEDAAKRIKQLFEQYQK